MNMNMNILLRGFVSKEIRVYGSYVDKQGKTQKVSELTLAIRDSHNKEHVEFIPVTFFNQTELLQKYTTVGSQLLILCSLKQNTYTKQNQKVYAGIQLIGEEVQFLSSPKESQ